MVAGGAFRTKKPKDIREKKKRRSGWSGGFHERIVRGMVQVLNTSPY